MEFDRDRGLDALLDLDGETFFVDREGCYRVQFVVRRVEASAEQPHGLSYSLTLHDETGERLVGFDNAHAVSSRRGPSGGKRIVRNHRHRELTTRPYDCTDAASLLPDFWGQVDAVLKERGVLP